jgi:hypothetical protein
LTLARSHLGAVLVLVENRSAAIGFLSPFATYAAVDRLFGKFGITFQDEVGVIEEALARMEAGLPAELRAVVDNKI